MKQNKQTLQCFQSILWRFFVKAKNSSFHLFYFHKGVSTQLYSLKKSVKIYTENKDSRHCNVSAKSFDFWHTGFAWQQLIYNCQTYLAMSGAKE